jgi:hypothetical protein
MRIFLTLTLSTDYDRALEAIINLSDRLNARLQVEPEDVPPGTNIAPPRHHRPRHHQ